MQKMEWVDRVLAVSQIDMAERFERYAEMGPQHFLEAVWQTAELYYMLRQVRQIAVSQTKHPDFIECLMNTASAVSLQIAANWLKADSEMPQALTASKSTLAELALLTADSELLTMTDRVSPLTRIYLQTAYAVRKKNATWATDEKWRFDKICGFDAELLTDGRLQHLPEGTSVLFAAALSSGVVMSLPAVFLQEVMKVPVAGLEYGAINVIQTGGHRKTGTNITIPKKAFAKVGVVILGDDYVLTGTSLQSMALAMSEKYQAPVYFKST